MAKDERLKNFTAKREIMEKLIKMFNLDVKEIIVKEIPKEKK